MRAVLGVEKKAGHAKVNLNLKPLLVETKVTPWDIQVQAQAVRLAGKLIGS